MRTKVFILGACLVFAVSLAVSSAANAAKDKVFPTKIEGLNPPLPATIVGWGSFDTHTAEEQEPAGIWFHNGLYDGYMALASSRRSAPDVDWLDSEHFNHKARTAGKGSIVLPDKESDRVLSKFDRPIFHAALFRMYTAFDRGGREVAPKSAAEAQVSYDCWIEATEYDREEEAKACRSAFESALARVEQVADYKLTEAPFVPSGVPQMAAMAPQPEGYLVYFEWDSTNMTPAGQAALQEAIRSAQNMAETRIALVGHADTSGQKAYNQTLSEKRALVVIQNMTAAGINRSRISWDAFGQTRLLVPTADGVREQGNRVVEVDLM
jgi:OOP family OmpA-OmpF porin